MVKFPLRIMKIKKISEDLTDKSRVMGRGWDTFATKY